ncbi:unnamed protein product [Linum tenue]|uniref:Uncharacterized protein n=1 Tax=Linum tenue TaxID=586396 RepID=A0AAV0H7G1_9ROSI|nr:unnamed protein product [Linum tenue]
MRLHILRQDRIRVQIWDRLQDQCLDRRPDGPLRLDPEPPAVGADGPGPRLLRAGTRGHLQRAGAVHRRSHLPPQPHLRRVWVPPRVVLRLRGGHLHRGPQAVPPNHLLRGSVAGHRRCALQAHGAARRLRAVDVGGGQGGGGRE